MAHTTLEISIRRLPNGSLVADATLTPSDSTATTQRATDPRLREAWSKARA